MTMFVDRRKDNYDELLVLARDARASRTRTYRWTTGLVITAFLGSAAYVATINQEVHELRESANDANRRLDAALTERNVYKAELDARDRYQDFYADVAPNFKLATELGDLRLVVRMVTDKTTATVKEVANLVWIVDGSRRFPMANGDVLWVPERKFWVRLETPEKPTSKSWGGVTLFRCEEISDCDDDNGESYPLGGPGRYYEEKIPEDEKRGNTDCIRLTLHDKSLRVGFTDAKYQDMEVLLSNNPDCRTGPFPPSEDTAQPDE